MQVPKFNVLLTSYDSLRADFKELARIEWQAVIIDEGQRMKNNNSKFFKLCLALQTRFRLLLSGTPLQNNFDELYNMMEFLDPEKFNKKFRTDLDRLRTENLQAEKLVEV